MQLVIPNVVAMGSEDGDDQLTIIFQVS